jgi:hypothetical protein
VPGQAPVHGDLDAATRSDLDAAQAERVGDGVGERGDAETPTNNDPLAGMLALGLRLNPGLPPLEPAPIDVVRNNVGIAMDLPLYPVPGFR